MDRGLTQLAQVGELLVVGFGIPLTHRAAAFYLRRARRVPRQTKGPPKRAPRASTMQGDPTQRRGTVADRSDLRSRKEWSSLRSTGPAVAGPAGRAPLRGRPRPGRSPRPHAAPPA